MTRAAVLNAIADAGAGRRERSATDAIRAIREGLPVAAADQLVESGRLSAAELDAVVIPRRTLNHRRSTGRLTADQSDRLVRVLSVIDLAEETFGSRETAATWLRRPTSALDGEAPLALLDTGQGAGLVERLLIRIAHGIAA